MRKSRLRELAIVSSLVVAGKLAVASTLSAQQKHVALPAKAKIVEWLHASRVPAVGIGLIQDGRVTEAKVFGEIEREFRPPITRSST